MEELGWRIQELGQGVNSEETRTTQSIKEKDKDMKEKF